MSYNLHPLKCVIARDPIMELDNERYYAILKGGAQISWRPITTTSISSSSIQFTAPPPSPKVVVDRKQLIELPMRLVLTSSAPNAFNLLRQDYDAPRAYPIASITNTLQANINNTAVSMNIADIIHALLHYNTDRFLKAHDYSMTASYPDQSQEYHDLNPSIRNPLSSYANSTDEDVEHRGAVKFQIVQNTPSQAVVDILVTEPIWLSPFYWGKCNAGGFYGVQTLDLNFTFLPNCWSRVWSHDDQGANAPGPINGGQLVFNNFTSVYPTQAFTYGPVVPQLLFKYITPNELHSIPNSIVYPYFNVDRYPNDYTTAVNPNAVMELVSQNIQLKSIPRRIYIYARNSNSVLFGQTGCRYTDTYLSIRGISVNWNNYSGLLSNTTEFDLYKMSVKNHCNLSFPQWCGGPVYGYGGVGPSGFNQLIGTVGSVLCIEMGTDIGLSDTECPGMLGTYQLQMSVTCVNKNQTNAITPTLYIVTVSEGTFTIENNRSISMIGVVSRMDVLNAKKMDCMCVNYEMTQDVNGGDFLSGLKKAGADLWSGIKSGLGTAYKYGKKAWPYIRTGLDIARTIGPFIGAGNEQQEQSNEAGNYAGAYAGCNDCEDQGEPQYQSEPQYQGASRIGLGGARVGGGKMMDRMKLLDRVRRG